MHLADYCNSDFFLSMLNRKIDDLCKNHILKLTNIPDNFFVDDTSFLATVVITL